MAYEPVTRKIDFYTLPRPVQERFAAATRSAAPPAPLLFNRAPRTRAWSYLGGSALLLVASVVVLRAGSGDLQSAVALHGAKMLALDSVLLAGAAYALLHGVGILLALDAMPYRPGLYLFPGCVVDAVGSRLEVWSMEDVESTQRSGLPAPAIAFHMRNGTRVVVRTPSAADAERLEATLDTVRGELRRAEAAGNPRARLEFDPLHDRAMSSPIGPSEAMRQSVALWMRFDWAIAVSIGIALGLALGTTRNSVSDAAMYRAIAEDPSVPSLTAYLAQGGSRGDGVRDVLLPRAELRDAELQGTIEAVDAFARSNPASTIRPEIDAALRRAMLAGLQKAKNEGTLSALNAFAQRYPQSSNYIDAELRAARHAFYAQALSAWKQTARPDAATEAFFGRLLAAAERSGPAVEVRFRREASTTMGDADRSILRNTHYPGPDALPSKYITDEALSEREKNVTADLATAFEHEFPADVLSMRPADSVLGDAPLAPGLPSLVIDYAPEWSRGNTATEKPSTIFAGFIFSFGAMFTCEGATPLKIGLKSWRGAAVWRSRPDGLTREAFEQKVYAAMIDGAFEQLEKKLRDSLL